MFVRPSRCLPRSTPDRAPSEPRPYLPQLGASATAGAAQEQRRKSLDAAALEDRANRVPRKSPLMNRPFQKG